MFKGVKKLREMRGEDEKKWEGSVGWDEREKWGGISEKDKRCEKGDGDKEGEIGVTIRTTIVMQLWILRELW